jgi:flavodoxin
MNKSGLFYGTTTENAATVADVIKDTFDGTLPDVVELFDIGNVETGDLLNYALLIIGCPPGTLANCKMIGILPTESWTIWTSA